jgi:hypothetical protein
MSTYEVVYESSHTTTKHEGRLDALGEFRTAVAEGIPVTVWEIPDAGGEARCIAHFPGII